MTSHFTTAPISRDGTSGTHFVVYCFTIAKQKGKNAFHSRFQNVRSKLKTTRKNNEKEKILWMVGGGDVKSWVIEYTPL